MNGPRPYPLRSHIRRRVQLDRDINAFVLGDVRRRSIASMLRTAAWWGTLVALAWLLPTLARAETPTCDAPPPAAEEWTWTLRAGCVVPYDVIAYTLSADLHARRADERNKSEIADLKLQLDDARSERKAGISEAADHIEDAADHLDGLVARLEKVQPVVTPAPLFSPGAWAGIDAAGMLACGAAALLWLPLDRTGREVGAGAAAAGCGAVLTWVATR